MVEHYDLLIRNTTIIDGTGGDSFAGDVGITGDRIVALGSLAGESDRELDGPGLVACPGFIDMHSHADYTILSHPAAESFLMQGVTTFVGGNCGLSPAPINDLLPALLPMLNGAPDWWRDAEAVGQVSFSSLYSYIPLNGYRDLLERKMSFALDWRSFGDFLANVESAGIAVNYVPLVGHNAIRVAAMGENFKRHATQTEIEIMKRHIEEAMDAGAFAFCTGLDSSAGEYAALDELIQLAQVARRRGGAYHTHTRHHQNNYPTDDLGRYDYGLYHGSADEIAVGRYRGLLEALEISRQADVRLQISHITPAYIINQPCPDSLHRAAAEATLEDIVDRPLRQGLDLAFDLIPDESAGVFSTPKMLDVFARWLPSQNRSKQRLLEMLLTPAFRNEVRRVLDSGEFKMLMLCPKIDPCWPEHFVILESANAKWAGKTLGQVARERGGDAVDAMCDLLLEDPETTFNQRDLRRLDPHTEVFLQHPACALGLDTFAYDTDFHLDSPFPNSIMAHQNTYGMLPRFIRRFVREKGVLTLEEAIRKATSVAAERLGIDDRGSLKTGHYADIVLFDPERITDTGDWLNPAQPPAGIHCVLVNGQVVYENGVGTAARPGRVVRRQ